MIGVSNSAPRLPVLVSVNVPPASSSGPTWPDLVRDGEVGDLAGEAADVQVAGAVDDRHHQAAVGVHGDAEVLGRVVGDLLRLRVDDRVELRVDLQRLDGRLREERQERQLDALAGLEGGLGPVAEPGDVGDVDLDHGGELGRGLQRLDHPLGDDLARPGHPLGGAAQRVGGRSPDGHGGSRAGAAAAAGAAAGRGRARQPRPGRRPQQRRRPRRPRRPRRLAAASMTSCLRIRPPTPVPAIDSSGTECSAASLRTSGVTYGESPVGSGVGSG